MPDPDDATIAAVWKHPRLRTPADYEDALSELEPYLVRPPERGTAAGDVFYALIEQIAAYETTHFSLENIPGMMSIH